MKLYHYNKHTGELLNVQESDKLLPFTTGVHPPKVKDGEVLLWDGKSWKVVQEKRGTYYRKSDGSVVKVKSLSEDISNLTVIPPPSIYSVWDEDMESWVYDIDRHKNDLLETLKHLYMVVCHETDNEYLKELKRKEAGIAKEKDAIDKEKAITRYKNATLLYEEKKAFIEGCKDVKVLESMTLEI